MSNDISLIGLLSFSTLLPFIIACGTCYIKFSIVFIMVRNALGLQQTPSNMTLNGIALMLAAFVMSPVITQSYENYRNGDYNLNSVESVSNFIENGIGGYRAYLERYTDPELAAFFEKAQNGQNNKQLESGDKGRPLSIISLLPAYALSEIKSAFLIGFYLYLPFVVIDLLVSSILLALGMMMMSPVTISVPIKLIMFVVLDGWTILSKGLILQYLDLTV